MNDIAWKYVGNGAFIDGVPARDLSQQDMDWLHPDLRSAVEISNLYRQPERSRAERPRTGRSKMEPLGMGTGTKTGEEEGPLSSPLADEGEGTNLKGDEE